MTWRDANKTPVIGRLFSDHLEKRLGPARKADEPLEQRHYNLAASMQAAIEEVLAAHWSALAEKTKQKNLCLAGGVAFNCVANGTIFDHSPFEKVYVQPAAGDAGLSVGAAFAVNNQILGQPRGFVMDHAAWGPGYSAPPKFAAPSTARFGESDDVSIEELAEQPLVEADRAPHRRRKNSRLVSGPRRMGSARARPAQHRRRSAPPRNERHSESPHQAPRNVPPVRAVDSRRSHRGIFRKDASIAVHDLRLPRAPGKAHRDSRAHARGRHRAPPNRQPHRQSALLEIDPRFRRSHRRARRAEHIVQRQRADRLPARRSARLFRRTRMDVLVIGNFILERKPAVAATHDMQPDRRVRAHRKRAT